MGNFRNPSRADIDAFLRRIRSIAIVGLSANSLRPSHGVARSLQSFGYRIVPINPALTSVLGERCWPNLEAAVAASDPGAPIDLVDVFRSPKFVPPIVNECIRLKLPAIWLQDGVIHEAAALHAQGAGLFTVMDRCLYRDRAMLAAS
jgi:predicted CoA-binding protein